VVRLGQKSTCPNFWNTIGLAKMFDFGEDDRASRRAERRREMDTTWSVGGEEVIRSLRI
jgi:hypothetical protein